MELQTKERAKSLIGLPEGFELALMPADKLGGRAFRLEILHHGKKSGLGLIFDPLDIKGGNSFTLDTLLGAESASRYCSCNGVSMSCPEGKSPHCDCTTNPPSLSCG